MPKIPECDSCQFYPQNPHIICAIHPYGVNKEHCPDFRPRAGAEEKLWIPEGYSYYAGELIKNPTRKLTPQQQLEILNTHPFFTGECPECGYKYDKNHPPAVHWDCPGCGWIDDAIH